MTVIVHRFVAAGTTHTLESDDGVGWTRCRQHGELSAAARRLVAVMGEQAPACLRKSLRGGMGVGTWTDPHPVRVYEDATVWWRSAESRGAGRWRSVDRSAGGCHVQLHNGTATVTFPSGRQMVRRMSGAYFDFEGRLVATVVHGRWVAHGPAPQRDTADGIDIAA